MVGAVRVTVLSAPIGGGHDTVAAAIALRCAAQGAELEVLRPIAVGKLYGRLPDLYRVLTTRTPAIWAAYYYGRRVPGLRAINSRAIQAKLVRSWRVEPLPKSDVVVLTSSIYCHSLGAIRSLASGVVVVAVTDLYGGPIEWFLPGADRYIVPSQEMRATALARGLSSHRIECALAPLNQPRGDVKIRCDQWSTGRRVPKVVAVGGSEGVGPLTSIARAAVTSDRPIRLVVVCGRNERLLRKLVACENDRLSVLGFHDDMYGLFRDCDLVITKPGSVTLMELLRLRKPFVVMPGNPGVERSNGTRLRDAGIPWIRGFRSARELFESLTFRGEGVVAGDRDLVKIVADLADGLPSRDIDLTMLTDPPVDSLLG